MALQCNEIMFGRYLRIKDDCESPFVDPATARSMADEYHAVSRLVRYAMNELEPADVYHLLRVVSEARTLCLQIRQTSTYDVYNLQALTQALAEVKL